MVDKYQLAEYIRSRLKAPYEQINFDLSALGGLSLAIVFRRMAKIKKALLILSILSKIGESKNEPGQISPPPLHRWKNVN